MVAVVLGAFGAHSLKSALTLELIESFETGVRYQMYHALALLFTGWATNLYDRREFSLAGWFFLAGIILFSGSLYVAALTDLKLGIITPFGGIAFVIGWYLLGRGFWRMKFQ